MSGQHELRRDLHFTLAVVLEGREVGLVLVRVHLFPVPVVGCRGQKTDRDWAGRCKLALIMGWKSLPMRYDNDCGCRPISCDSL